MADFKSMSEAQRGAVVTHIMTAFKAAQDFKMSSGVTTRLFENLYNRLGKPDPNNCQMVEVSKDPAGRTFIEAGAAKVRTLYSLLRENYINLPDHGVPIDISNIQTSSIPEEQKQRVRDIVLQRIQAEMQGHMQAGVAPDVALAALDLREVGELTTQARDAVLRELDTANAKSARRADKAVTEMLIEGGWAGAMDVTLYDVATFPSAFVKGPFPMRKRKATGHNKDGSPRFKDTTVLGMDPVSPFDAFPAPGAASAQEGPYFIEFGGVSVSELKQWKFLDGAIKFAIDNIIENILTSKAAHNGMGVTASGQWVDLVHRSQQDMALHGATIGAFTPLQYGHEVDYLRYYGKIGADVFDKVSVPRPKDMKDTDVIEVVAVVINQQLVQLSVNNEPLGRRPIHSIPCHSVPGSVWGVSFYESFKGPLDQMIKTARNIVRNGVYCSGPIGEINYDRLHVDERAPQRVAPLRLYRVKSPTAPGQGRVLHIDTIDCHLERFEALYLFWKAEMDRMSGLPAYISDGQLASAARTNDIVSALQTNALRGVNGILTNIDQHAIEPIAKIALTFIQTYPTHFGVYGDLEPVVRGLNGVLRKELGNARLLDILRIVSASPASETVGQDGFRRLLRAIIDGRGGDGDDLVPEVSEAEQLQQLLGVLQSNPELAQVVQQATTPQQTQGQARP